MILKEPVEHSQKSVPKHNPSTEYTEEFKNQSKTKRCTLPLSRFSWTLR